MARDKNMSWPYWKVFTNMPFVMVSVSNGVSYTVVNSRRMLKDLIVISLKSDC